MRGRVVGRHRVRLRAIIVKCAAGSGGLWVEICGGKKWLPTVLELTSSPYPPTEKRVDIYSLAIFALLRIMVYRVDIHAIEPKSGVWDPSRIGP